MPGKRILFTGQSGIKIDSIINDFVNSYAEFNEQNRPKVIKVEDRMFKIYCREKQVDVKANPNKWVDLLKEPISVIVRISNEAFNEITEEIKKEESDIFLICHACFYHLQTLEFIALPSLKYLKDFNPSKIITFIDDIYDIHIRLRQAKQLLVGSKDVVDTMIFDLLKILDWRINEISLSRYFSNQLGIPKHHYVFAVKHPKRTLYDVIYGIDKTTLYLSHPISQPRRFQDQGKNELALPIIQEIKELSEYFSNKFICFLPTTIDELRIKDSKDEQGKREKFIYGLKDRWEIEAYEKPNTQILYQIPENTQRRIPFGEPIIIDGELLKENESVPYLLGALFKAIDRQVSIRDKKLVEQSDVLFIYRPGFTANLSKGVRLELKYYQLLNKTQHDRINCIIYYPKSDQNELKLKIASLEINKKISSSPLVFGDNDKIKIIDNWDNGEEFADIIEGLLLKHQKDANVDTGTLYQDPYGERRDFFLKLATDIKQEFEHGEDGISYYKNQCDVFIETDNLKPHEIINEIQSQLKMKP